MKPIRLACLCPVLLSATLASAAPARPGSIQGTVVNSVTGQSVRKAVVCLSDRRNQFAYAAVTDDTGGFTVAGVAPGPYYVGTVVAQGYSSQPKGHAANGQGLIEVAEDQQVTGVRVELTPLGVISGKVVDEDGEPLRDVHIQAIESDYPGGLRQYSVAASANTDDRGEFRVIDLRPGRYYVDAWMPPFSHVLRGPVPEAQPVGTIRNIPDMEYATTYAPASSDLAGATAIVVTAGSETPGVEIRLRPWPVFHIRGRVSNLPLGGSGQIGAKECGRTEVMNAGWRFLAMAKLDGSFDLSGVTPGTYCVSLVPNGATRSVYAGQSVTVADRNQDEVNLAASPLLPVSGTVTFDGRGDPPQGMSVSLRSLAGTMGGSSRVGPGKISMDSVFPDTYQVSLNGLPQSMYLKSIQYATQEMPSGVVPIRGDGSLLALAIGADTGSLSGSVQTENGDPANGATAIAIPDDFPPGRADLVKRATADPSGKFTMQGVPPGSYKVYAWEDNGLFNLSMVAEFIKEFSGSAAAVAVSPGGSGTVQVKLIPFADSERVKARF